MIFCRGGSSCSEAQRFQAWRSRWHWPRSGALKTTAASGKDRTQPTREDPGGWGNNLSAGGELVLRGYSNRRGMAQPATVTHAVVMIHGVLRNPDNYYLPAQRAVLARKSLLTKIALISVGFDDHASAPETCRTWHCSIRIGNTAALAGLDPDDPNNKLSSFRDGSRPDRSDENLPASEENHADRSFGGSGSLWIVTRRIGPLVGNVSEVTLRFVASRALIGPISQPTASGSRQGRWTVLCDTFRCSWLR